MKRKSFITFLTAIGMSSCISLIIFFFVWIPSEQVMVASSADDRKTPHLSVSGMGGNWESPVFQQRDPIPLQHAQLVSFMKHIPSLHAYKRVRLDRADIFIDYQVNSKRWNEDQLFADAYQALKHFFIYTSNINQLYMRFIYTDDEHQTLIIAITSRKENVNREMLFEDLSLEKQRFFILENTRVVYGTGWRY